MSTLRPYVLVFLAAAFTNLSCGRTAPSSKAAANAPVPLRSGVFGGGPLYNQASTVVPQLKAAGFNMVMLWTLHVNEHSDLIFNDIPLITGGKYVGDPTWPDLINSLKGKQSGVDRVEFSVGAYSVPDFETLQRIIAAEPQLGNSMLARNFRVLRSLLPVLDGISYDDESNYDLASTLQFTKLLGDLGFKVTLTPYTYGDFWHQLYTQTEAANPGQIDRIYLQGYAGGTGNNPDAWNALFPGHEVDLGLWSQHGDSCDSGDSPWAVHNKLKSYGASIAGGMAVAAR